MRLHLHTTPNIGIIPFNYHHKLTGTLHKWLSLNSVHGDVSLYSFSWLMNGNSTKEGLDYPNGAKMFISFWDDRYIKQILSTILEKPEICYGLRVTDVSIQENPNLSNQEVFRCGSPIFIKRNENGRNIHYTYDTDFSGNLLKETLSHKMEIAGLPVDETLQIRFDTSYPQKKIKLIDYKGIKNKVNQCSVIIQGKPETKEFAWNVGLGNSTGIGFGSIY